MAGLLRCGLFVALSNLAWAEGSKLSRDLVYATTNDVDVIIQFRQAPLGADVRKVLDRGGTFKANLKLVRGVAFSVPRRTLTALAADPQVEYVSLDRRVEASLDSATPAVGAYLAWEYGWFGRGVGIAVIDSGISPHPDLDYPGGGLRLAYSESFFEDPSTLDRRGHGTHVAGVAAGNGRLSSGSRSVVTFRGVAPSVHLINLRVLDRDGGGRDSGVIAAIERAIELKDVYNIRVVNLSLGRPVYESYRQDPLCQAVEAAWQAGLVVVAAAGNHGREDWSGNEGYGTITAPGNDPFVITVGAMKTFGTPNRADDLIASYSSKGPTLLDHIVKPDLVAPGNGVVSVCAPGAVLAELAVPVWYWRRGAGPWRQEGAYCALSGTSMAAAMVSGAAALLLEKEPGLTPDQVKARLMGTASRVFPSDSIAVDPATGTAYHSRYDIFTVGAGYLDLAAALATSDVAAGQALSPQAAYDPASGSITVISGPSSVGEFSAVWGTGAGGVSLSGASAVWGTSAVWGSTTPLGAESLRITIRGE